MNHPFDSYEMVLGFECHVQLKTVSKLFSSGPNVFGAAPNSALHIVDAGLPGVLPTLNKNVVDFAIKLGLALGCTINRESVFARKHYFYPDLPKGYQISQFDKPICEHGTLNFMVDGQQKSVRIQRIHIEEDAGKNMHPEGVNASYVDFNRAGTPLLEVVSEPDLHAPKDAMEAFKALRQLVTFLDICDGNMQEGSMRCDINVSVRKVGDKNLGTRTETKNLNSFRFLGQAIVFEAHRQIIELEAGRSIRQETRQWDPNTKESYPLRSKEEAHDYRYFPDPDLLPLVISEQKINALTSSLPELPYVKNLRYQSQYGLNDHDAHMLTGDRILSSYFEKALALHNNPKAIANVIINDVLRAVKDDVDAENGLNESSLRIPAETIAELVRQIDEQIISSNIAKRVFAILEKSPERSVAQIVTDNGWQMVSDQSQINSLVDQVIRDNPDEVAKYCSGKAKVFGFLMGQLMKLSMGKIDPKSANQLMLDGLAKISANKSN